MSNSSSEKILKYKFGCWWIVLFPILSLFIEFLWRPLFVSEKVIGIYWLFFFVQEGSLVLAGLTIILSAIFFVLPQEESKFVVREIGLALLLSSFVFIFIFLAVFIQYKRGIHHLDKLSTQEKTFYLASFPASSLSVDFGLYECDKYGVICKQVFRSGESEYYESDFGAQLMYDQDLNTVEIYKPRYGIIYKYKIP
jgi:hypothetical protein